MSAAASDARRKAEIEAKKAKLLEIRRQREERATRLKTVGAPDAASSSASGAATPARKDLDDLVNSLISGAGAGTSRASGEDSPRKSVVSRASGHAPDAPSSEFGESEPDAVPASTRPLVETQRELFELPPKQRVYYTKQVQTTETSPADAPRIDSGGVGAEPRETEDALRARILAEHAEEQAARHEEERLERELHAQLRELTEQERLAVYAAHDFSDFVAHSAKIVERAMADKYDYMVDYRLDAAAGDNAARTSQLRLVRTFAASGADAKLFENRSVTALDWSTRFPELCVAAYNRNAQDEEQPAGLVAVWNMRLRERPEFVFHAPTDVVSVCFSPFHPTLVIGGTYSGQMLVWDTRARHLPVLKTPLSAAGHTHPVYGLRMVGSANANHLVSAASDGSVCWWMLDMLARPHETLELTSPLHAKTDEVAITTLGVADQESTALLVGTEEGAVYAANRYDRAGLKAGLNAHEVYRGHLAPVTGIDFHPLSQSYTAQHDAQPTQRHAGVDFSDLFLTSSMDWTSKLWRLTPGTAAKPRAADTGAILTFEESNDHIYDVKWSPAHPAVFAQVDGTGRFDVFNLNVDTERPIASAFPASTALNKLSWAKPGAHVALGASDGRVYIYQLPDALASPAQSDFLAFQKTVTQLLAK